MEGRVLDTLAVEITHIKPSTLLLKLIGEMDNLMFADLKSFVFENTDRHENAIVVDVSALSYVDSCGIKLLDELMTRFGEEKVALFGVTKNILRILEIPRYETKVKYVRMSCDTREWPSSEIGIEDLYYQLRRVT